VIDMLTSRPTTKPFRLSCLSMYLCGLFRYNVRLDVVIYFAVRLDADLLANYSSIICLNSTNGFENNAKSNRFCNFPVIFLKTESPNFVNERSDKYTVLSLRRGIFVVFMHDGYGC
jgi:hypothetical protein